MQKFIGKILCAILILFAFSAYSINLPKRTIGNTEFYCYKVAAKETIYGISRKLNVSKDDLMKYNPALVDGLKKDYVLLIPVNLLDSDNNVNSNIKADIDVDSNVTHIVDKGETLYGLSKMYNVTQDEIISLNPSVKAGLKSGQRIVIPQPKQEVSSASDASSIVFHTIKKGETLYSLSKQYNTSIEGILALNPGVSPTNFKVDEIIKIQPNSVKSELKETSVTTMVPYVAKKGDNYKKIAKDNDIDIDDLKAANPNTNKVKAGKTIQIPVTTKDSVLMVVNEGTENELRYNSSARIKEIYDSIHDIKSGNGIKIAMLLPYMLDEQSPSKQARLYTEFYKGFLIALDKARKQCEENIEVFAYDTKSSSAQLDSLLSLPELKEMDLIFATDDSEQLKTISAYCNENKIYMVNAFSLKTEDYNTNPYMFQINTPQTFMYADVYDWFDNEFKDHEIVFVHKKGSTKKDFANDLKSHIESSGKSVAQMEYVTSLMAEKLSEHTDSLKKYLFIPTSGTKNVMSKLVSAVKALKADRSDIQVSVLGYPEWVTYTDEWQKTFHAVDTYFYSRFFTNPDNPKLEEFNSLYKKWYGEKTLNAAPVFGLLGYDAGMYFIDAMCDAKNDISKIDNNYDGIQSHFNFERTSNWSGYINKSVYIIHYTPSNDIEIEVK